MPICVGSFEFRLSKYRLLEFGTEAARQIDRTTGAVFIYV